MSYAKLNQERSHQEICAYVLENWRVMTFSRLLRRLGCGARALWGAFKTLELEPRSGAEVFVTKACQREAAASMPPPPPAPPPLPDREPAELPAPAPARRTAKVISALDYLPRPKRQPYKKRKFYNEPAVTPDPPKKPFIRPPAVYTNSSPYGIASDMLLHPEKYERDDSDQEEKPEVAYYGAHAVSKKIMPQKRV